MRPAFLVKGKKNQEKEAAGLITGKFLRQRIALKLLLNVLELAGFTSFFFYEGGVRCLWCLPLMLEERRRPAPLFPLIFP